MPRVLTLTVLIGFAAPAPALAQKEQEKKQEKVDPKVAKLRKQADDLWGRAMKKYEAAGEAKNEKVQDQLYDDVAALFDEVVKLGTDSGKYGIALFNAAVIYMGRGKRHDDEALRRFQKLIASDANDKDPSGSLMRPYRNYRFHAWSHTSNILESRGEVFAALDAHFKSRVAYVSHCANCINSMEAGFVRSLRRRSLAIVHGEKAGKLDEKARERDEELVDAALTNAKHARGFVVEFADWLERAGRKAAAKRVLAVLPKPKPPKKKKAAGKRK